MILLFETSDIVNIALLGCAADTGNGGQVDSVKCVLQILVTVGK
jgi:hypothetical protein